MKKFETPEDYANYLMSKFNVDWMTDSAIDSISETRIICEDVISELLEFVEDESVTAFLVVAKQELNNIKKIK